MSEKVRLTRDEGSALVAAVGIMAVFTVLAIAAFTLSDQHMFQSKRDRNSTMALHIADAGMDTAMWKIRRVGSHIESSFTVPAANGVATVTATPVGSYQFELKSVGHTYDSPNTKRIITCRVFYVSLWNFIMGTGSLAAGGGGALVGNTSVNGPFYVRGTLPLSGGAQLTGGPLFVKKGDIMIQSSGGGIGTASEWIDVFCDGTYPTPAGASTRFYANVDINVPDLQLPPLGSTELLTFYNRARQESIDGRYGTNGSGDPNTEVAVPPTPPGALAGYYKVIDADSTPGGATTSLVFDENTPAFGTPTDDFAWDPATATLYIAGTVFVDGPVQFGSSSPSGLQDIRYLGNGTIVSTADITVNGELLPTRSYPSQDAMGLTTPLNLIINAQAGNSPNPTYADATLAGAYFCGGEARFPNSIVLRGSILTSTLRFTSNNNHLLTDPQLPDYLPPSMPGGTDRMVFPTRWHEGVN